MTDAPKRDDVADMQATLDYAHARHLRMLRELAKAEAEIARLREAGAAILGRYVTLASSGDAGFWNPEEEPEVIAARAAFGSKP